MEFSEKFDEILPAIIESKGKFVKPVKDKFNSGFKNHYATLDSVLNAITPGLDANNLILMQSMKELGESNNSTMHVETMIVHTVSGQWVKSYTKIPIVKNDPQGAGSAFTYARRYGIVALLGLSQADDDAQSAVKTSREWINDLKAAAKLPDDATQDDRENAIVELQGIVSSCWKGLDAASKKVVRDEFEKLKASIEGKSARGFNAESLSKKKVEQAQAQPEPVQEPKPAGKIDNF